MPPFPEDLAQDAQVADVVLAAQNSEIDALWARLHEGQRNRSWLETRLRNASNELLSANLANASAVEQLETHISRSNAVLVAGVERCRAERGALESELQRVEQSLWQRDAEIARLRQAGQKLETSRFQGELELRGLKAAEKKMNTEIRNFGAGVAELWNSLDQGNDVVSCRPSPHEAMRIDEVTDELTAKMEERSTLRQRAETSIIEVRRLEAEVAAAKTRARSLEHDLRTKQKQIDSKDHETTSEVEGLQARCKELKALLHQEEKSAAEAGQRGAVSSLSAADAETLNREVGKSFNTVNGLSAALRDRGLALSSAEVPDDPIDVKLHSYLRSARGSDLPPLVWRLGCGEYIIGEDHVWLVDVDGIPMVNTSGNTLSGVITPVSFFAQQQAVRAKSARVVPWQRMSSSNLTVL